MSTTRWGIGLRCFVGECGRVVEAHGMCRAHYMRHRRTGAAWPPVVVLCSWPGCENEFVKVQGAKYCSVCKTSAYRSKSQSRNPPTPSARSRQREHIAAWKRRHPEAARLTDHKRRARMSGGGVAKVSPSEAARLRRQPCMYCGGVSSHLDHRIPLSRGGAHSLGNLSPACRRCNLSKGSATVTEWRKRLGLLGKLDSAPCYGEIERAA